MSSKLRQLHQICFNTQSNYKPVPNWNFSTAKLYCIVFILCAISPCTTGLKVLYERSESNSQITVICLTERQRLKNDHLSTSLRFFSLSLGIGPNDREQRFSVVIRAHYIYACTWFEPMSSVFLGECHTRPQLKSVIGICFCKVNCKQIKLTFTSTTC